MQGTIAHMHTCTYHVTCMYVCMCTRVKKGENYVIRKTCMYVMCNTLGQKKKIKKKTHGYICVHDNIT